MDNVLVYPLQIDFGLACDLDKVEGGSSGGFDLGGLEQGNPETAPQEPTGRPGLRRLSSRKFQERPDIMNLSNRNNICGTFLHMAPEVVTSETYDEKVDIFSLGMVMFQIFSYTSMVTVLHQSGFTVKDGQAAIVGGWRPPLHFCGSLPVRSLIERCWSTDPELRPTAEEVVAELMTYLAEDSADKLKTAGGLKRFVQSVKSLARSASGKPRVRRFSEAGAPPSTSTSDSGFGAGHHMPSPFLSVRRFSYASCSGAAELFSLPARSGRSSSSDKNARHWSNDSASSESKAMWDEVARTLVPADTTPKVAKPLRKQHEDEVSEYTSNDDTSDFCRYAV